jgi:3-dehydroquinate synthase
VVADKIEKIGMTSKGGGVRSPEGRQYLIAFDFHSGQVYHRSEHFHGLPRKNTPLPKSIEVKIPGTRRPYAIQVHAGLFHTLPRLLEEQDGCPRSFIITDTHVGRLYGSTLQRRLWLRGHDVLLLGVPAGELSKNIRTVDSLHTQLLRHGVTRNSLIIALGGGVVGDLAGFVAATILRGIPWVQVPTSLLAQVDSSIGAKVGINHPLGKNLVGAFYPPRAIFTDPGVLRTLPRNEFRNGLAEVVKIAFAADPLFFGWLERHRAVISRENLPVLKKLVPRSASLKAAIVSRDATDTGIRKMLNFGHTVGHALETAAGYRIPHGRAVSIGLAVESHMSVRMGLLPAGEQERLTGLLVTFRLPVKIPAGVDRRRMLAALAVDKKTTDGAIMFALPRKMGDMRTAVRVPEALIRESILHS